MHSPQLPLRHSCAIDNTVLDCDIQQRYLSVGSNRFAGFGKVDLIASGFNSRWHGQGRNPWRLLIGLLTVKLSQE